MITVPSPYLAMLRELAIFHQQMVGGWGRGGESLTSDARREVRPDGMRAGLRLGCRFTGRREASLGLRLTKGARGTEYDLSRSEVAIADDAEPAGLG